MHHHGLPCPACHQSTDVIDGWPSVNEESHDDGQFLTVDAGPYTCAHCHEQFKIELLGLAMRGDEKVPIIAATPVDFHSL